MRDSTREPTKWDLQKQYWHELREHGGKVAGEVRSPEGWCEERLRWLERVDEAVDEIANHLGLEVPYAIVAADGHTDYARYNPAYRLEMLKKLIKGGGE